MSRPTITLCMIMKNEAENIKQLHDSIDGCFDEIHVVDTGSTDESVAIAGSMGWKVTLSDWRDDFSYSRNLSIENVKTDFWMWMDLDDVLSDKGHFNHFRDHVMNVADMWLATYHYQMSSDNKPQCSFARERVFRTAKGFKFKYPVHEGVVPETANGEVRMQLIPSWAVIHKRTEDDINKDRSRNIKILEKQEKLDPRLKYYYGKELFENGEQQKSYGVLIDAISDPGLEQHDRVLGIQYACYAGGFSQDYSRVIALAHQGLQLDSNRAEFYIIIADSYVSMGQLQNAMPYYSAAKACANRGAGGTAIFTHKDAYGMYPSLQRAKLFANMGDLEMARREAYEALDKYHHPEIEATVNELEKIKRNTLINFKAPLRDDIVITCGPSPYEWDADLMKTQSMGGSETAAIQMAYWLRKLSGRPVRIFNGRKNNKVCDGVEYHDNGLTSQWLRDNHPYAHIAWRHNSRITNARTFLWCHDLITPGAEDSSIYEKILALTPFHKDYLVGMQGVDPKNIIVTRNGIDPEKFKEKKSKNVNKVLFTSSPDRGLDRAMLVCDKVLDAIPQLELHVFYGIEHLHKYGLQSLADKLKGMMDERPYVKYHGAVPQDVLVGHMMDAATWLYPSDWIETSCITAMEMICAGVFPVVRRIGGVADTLSKAEQDGMASLIDSECSTDAHRELFATALKSSIRRSRWSEVSVNPQDYSWEQVAREWLEWL